MLHANLNLLLIKCSALGQLPNTKNKTVSYHVVKTKSVGELKTKKTRPNDSRLVSKLTTFCIHDVCFGPASEQRLQK